VSRGQHIAADGPFNRSATTGLARGVALIVAAVIVGVLLLRSTDGSEPFRAAGTGTDQTGAPTTSPTTKPAGPATTTTAAPEKAHEPAQVTVLVANGSSVKGGAGKIATRLNASNYVTAPAVNTTAPATASTVYFTAGYEPDAKAIAAILKPTPGVAAMPNPLPVASLGAAHVLVVLAADLANS
jgi:hypothetical protein